MSKNNVAELFGKKGVATDVSDGGELSATNRSAPSGGGTGQPAPNTAAELDEEILDALRSARKGLTDDGIAAVIALRQEISIHTALEQLLLGGAIGARLEE